MMWGVQNFSSLSKVSKLSMNKILIRNQTQNEFLVLLTLWSIAVALFRSIKSAHFVLCKPSHSETPKYPSSELRSFSVRNCSNCAVLTGLLLFAYRNIMVLLWKHFNIFLLSFLSRHRLHCHRIPDSENGCLSCWLLFPKNNIRNLGLWLGQFPAVLEMAPSLLLPFCK